MEATLFTHLPNQSTRMGKLLSQLWSHAGARLFDANEIDFNQQDDGDASSSGTCKVCYTTPNTLAGLPGTDRKTKMITRSKCEFCHAVHLLKYGEFSWKDKQ